MTPLAFVIYKKSSAVMGLFEIVDVIYQYMTCVISKNGRNLNLEKNEWWKKKTSKTPFYLDFKL